MTKQEFTMEENRMLTEIYRRLNYFNKGDLNSCILLEVPSRAKCLIKLGLIQPSYSRETPRALNWYKLTEKGQRFFTYYLGNINDKTNEALFNGVIKTFNKLLIN